MNSKLWFSHFSAVLILLSLAGCNTVAPARQRAALLVTQLRELKPNESAVAINKQLIALGEASVAEVIKLLESSDPRDRTNAAWVLGEIQSQAALPALKRALVVETDDSAKEIQVQAVCSILRIPNDIAAQEAIKAIEESNQ